MFETKNFIQQALEGTLANVDDDIEEAIDEWHKRGGKALEGKAVTLPEWLGMTADEYKLFVEQPTALEPILMSRQYNVPLKDILKAASGTTTIAARSSGADFDKILAWLKKTGRI